MSRERGNRKSGPKLRWLYNDVFCKKRPLKQSAASVLKSFEPSFQLLAKFCPHSFKNTSIENSNAMCRLCSLRRWPRWCCFTVHVTDVQSGIECHDWGFRQQRHQDKRSSAPKLWPIAARGKNVGHIEPQLHLNPLWALTHCNVSYNHNKKYTCTILHRCQCW